MKKMSKKMSKATRSYSKLRKTFLLNNPMCHVRSTDCTLQTTDVHHKLGRGMHHLDVITWLPVCRSCHDWIHNNPIDAKELGFLISKLT